MGRDYELYVVDAFTRTPFAGNPAGVVPDAQGLTEGEMRAIAREVNVSETAFVLPPEGANHDLSVRFFTPRVEVPICGHATIATHHVLHKTGREKASKKGNRIFQKTKAGIHAVDLILGDEGLTVVMNQPLPEFTDLPAELPVEVLIEALGLDESEVDPKLPIMCAFPGEYTVYIPVKSRSVVDSLKPDMQRLSTMYASYFVFTLDTGNPSVLTYCRMFAPAYGIPEDPVTGMGNGPLGAYLVAHGGYAASESPFRFFSRQGVAMGRPGEMTVAVDHDGPVVKGVRVAGAAVTIFRSKFSLG